MVRSFLLYCLLLLLPLSGHTADVAELWILADKNQLEMGKYLSVRLVYIGNDIPDTSHLETWYEDFFVDRGETEAEDLPGGLIQYTERMRLYPRSAGSKMLHSIALGGAFSQPVGIEVKPVIRDGIDGTPQWQSLPESIWQGETIKVTVVQNLLHPSNEIVMENVSFPGFYVQKIGQEIVQEQIIENNKKTVHLNWLITAQSYGIFQLELPAIVQRGRGRWRFYLPRAVIRVKPLASYIPPTIPVGKLSIHTGLTYEEDKPFWFVELHNEGQLPEEVYGIRTQLAELTGQPVEAVKQLTDKETSSEDSTGAGSDSPLDFVHRYQIPVPEWTWGISAGPEIMVPYFDVHKGHVITVSKRLPAVWYISKTGRYLLFIMLAFILVVILNMSFKRLKNILAWRRYRDLLRQVNQAHELRKILLAQGNFLTLEAWSAFEISLDTSRMGQGNMTKHIARQLNALCYARTTQISVDEVKHQVIDLHTFRYWLMFNR